MENLPVENLRKLMGDIVKLAECPVCLETLRPKVRQCRQGHMVCDLCQVHLTNQQCPVCRSSFSDVQPVFVQQLIELLPHFCRFKKCDYFVQSGDDDHEVFCTFKPTTCRYCRWAGAERQLVDHLKSAHKRLTKYLVPLFGILENGIPFNPKVNCSVFTPILVDGHFFWGEMKSEPSNNRLTAIFHPVANGKTTVVFNAYIKLGHDDRYSANIKLNMDPKVDPYKENCISIPTTNLEKYTVDDQLVYRLGVDVIHIATLSSWLECGIKTGVEYLNNVKSHVMSQVSRAPRASTSKLPSPNTKNDTARPKT